MLEKITTWLHADQWVSYVSNAMSILRIKCLNSSSLYFKIIYKKLIQGSNSKQHSINMKFGMHIKKRKKEKI